MTENRKLIPMEQGMEMFNRLGNSLNVIIVSRIRGNLNEEVLRQALDLAQIRHPRLNCRIVGSLEDLRFENENTQKIPLRIVYNVNSEHWKSVAIDELNTKIESEKILIRSVLVKTADSNISYFITTVHHAIIDAISGIYLHSEICSIYSKIFSESKIPNISKLPVLPSLEELLPKIVKVNSQDKQTDKKIKTLKFEKYLPNELRSCGLVHKKLTSELTKRIVSYSKEENTTVHGVLCAAMLLAVAEKLKNEEGSLYLSCRSSVDLRRRINPPVSDENIAMVVSALTSFHEIRKDKSFREVAREVSRQIKAKLQTYEIYNVVLSYKKGTEFLLNNPDKVPFSVFITNICRVRIPSDYGFCKIEEISYALSLNAMGSVFALAASTFEEEMILNFIYSQPAISQETIETLINSTISILLQGVSSN